MNKTYKINKINYLKRFILKKVTVNNSFFGGTDKYLESARRDLQFDTKTNHIIIMNSVFYSS